MDSRQRTTLLVGLLAFLFIVFLCLCLVLAYMVGSAVVSSPGEATVEVTVVPPPTVVTLPLETPVAPTAPIVTPVPTPTPQRQVQLAPYDPSKDLETQLLTWVYDHVNPSVVNIQTDEAGGSGFVWDDQGHIVTNFHVVHGAKEIRVTFADDTEATATLVGEDADSDLAVIRVDPKGLTLVPVVLGDSTRLRVGERAIAIGNPFGLAGTMTSGIISALGRSIAAPSNYLIPEAIQTDAPVNPGNSGGPLLDARGEVIGVVSQIRSPVRANAGIGFAVPIHIAKRVVPVLIEKGSYQHPFIGISGITLSPEVNEVLGLPRNLRGAYVNEVLEGYPAAEAGIRGGTEDTDYVIGFDDQGNPLYLKKGGDVIIAINDQPVRRFDDLLVYLFRYASPGDTVVLTVLRDGKEMKIPVKLGVRPSRQ